MADRFSRRRFQRRAREHAAELSTAPMQRNQNAELRRLGKLYVKRFKRDPEGLTSADMWRELAGVSDSDDNDTVVEKTLKWGVENGVTLAILWTVAYVGVNLHAGRQESFDRDTDLWQFYGNVFDYAMARFGEQLPATPEHLPQLERARDTGVLYRLGANGTNPLRQMVEVCKKHGTDPKIVEAYLVLPWVDLCLNSRWADHALFKDWDLDNLPDQQTLYHVLVAEEAGMFRMCRVEYMTDEEEEAAGYRELRGFWRDAPRRWNFLGPKFRLYFPPAGEKRYHFRVEEVADSEDDIETMKAIEAGVLPLPPSFRPRPEKSEPTKDEP